MQILPSVFQIAEYPTYYCHSQGQELIGQARITPESWRQYEARLVTPDLPYFCAEFLAWPLTLSLTPITMALDPLIGIGEGLYHWKQGRSKEAIKEVLYKKAVVSPIQQATVLGVAAVPMVFFGGFLCLLGLTGRGPKTNFKDLLVISGVGGALMGSTVGGGLARVFGQRAVGKLPKGFNHKTFNIFINGGSKRHCDTHLWVDGVK